MTGINWQERHRFFNGPIKCQLLVGRESQMGEKAAHSWTLVPLESGSPGEDFANRLIKNCAFLLPWAKEEGVTCFRIYDSDIPEYNLAVDLYEEWIHVQEYAPPATIDQEKAEQRFSLALQVIRSVFDTPRSRLFIKTRQKQKGTRSSTRKNRDPAPCTRSMKAAAVFWSISPIISTPACSSTTAITRARLGQLAQGKTFLNLFAYTGTATVYAAMGGATATTTVDISETYLTRAQANLALNGFGGPLHQTVEADCIDWLKRNHERFGVIFVDPPTFSNARHRNQTFDVQKDHPALLRLAMQHLAKGGTLVFSSNFRKFKLDESLTRDFAVREISDETVPPDFQRNRRIHRCWEFRHREQQDASAETAA